LGFLNQKLGVDTAERLRAEVAARIAEYDFRHLAVDVTPFLMNREDIQRVEKSREFWNYAALA